MIMRFAGVLLGTLSLGAAASANTLDDELSRLLGSHPRIHESKAQLLASEEALQSALGLYYPSVNVNGDYGFERVDSPATRALTGGTTRMPRVTGEVDLTQNLFDGFFTKASHQSAQVEVQRRRAEVARITQDVLIEGIRAYLDVIRRRELVTLAKMNENTILQQLNLEDERVQRGAGISVDVLLAKSRLQTSKERRVAFEGQLENAITRYTQVFDNLPPMDRMLVPALPVDQLPTDLSKAVHVALSERPIVVVRNREVDLADVGKDIARSAYYPEVDAVAKARYENDVSGVEGARRDLSILLQASWELFSGFSNTADVAQAKYLHKASLDTLTFANRQVIQDVKLAWQNLLTARERVALLENAVALASEVHVSFSKLRDAGQATIFEVLDAQNEIFDAQINEANANFDARVAVYQLLRSVGRLDAGTLTLDQSLPEISSKDLLDKLEFLDAEVPSDLELERSAGLAAPEPVAPAEPAEQPQIEAVIELAPGQTGEAVPLPWLAEDSEGVAAPPPPDVAAAPTQMAPVATTAPDGMTLPPPPEIAATPGQAVPSGADSPDTMALPPAPVANTAPGDQPVQTAGTQTLPPPPAAIQPLDPLPADGGMVGSETVFIASDGEILDDPNFQRVWSYDY